ncbi:DUF4436 family protein [Actinomycetes bacterium M1A6_2h]
MPTSTRTRVSAVALLLVLLYAVVVAAYALGDRDAAPDTRQASASGTLVYLDVVAVDGLTYSFDAKVSVYPGSELVDSDGYLTSDMVVDVSPIADDGRLDYPSGTRVGALPASLYASGDIRSWPFDRYTSDSLSVRVFLERNGTRESVPADVVVTDSASGWNIDQSGDGPVTLVASRTVGATVFDLALCAILAVLPLCTLFVSIQTLRRRKQFLPPIVTWFAVMLFAVLPIRNIFPGAPPTGSWVDYTVVLWVVLGLVTSLVLYVVAWWRDGP